MKVFQLVDELIRVRRESVYRGLTDPHPKLDEEEKQLYIDWLALVEKDMGPLEALEKTFGVIEGSPDLRGCRERAHAFLATWAPANPATAVGSRVLEFSEEDADQIQALLNSPAEAPGRPARPSRSVPTGDSSLLK